MLGQGRDHVRGRHRQGRHHDWREAPGRRQAQRRGDDGAVSPTSYIHICMYPNPPKKHKPEWTPRSRRWPNHSLSPPPSPPPPPPHTHTHTKTQEHKIPPKLNPPTDPNPFPPQKKTGGTPRSRRRPRRGWRRWRPRPASWAGGGGPRRRCTTSCRP